MLPYQPDTKVAENVKSIDRSKQEMMGFEYLFSLVLVQFILIVYLYNLAFNDHVFNNYLAKNPETVTVGSRGWL